MITIYNMDVMDGLTQLTDESVHCVITSPPYFNQRDYGIEGQIGLEKTIGEYVEKMVEVFREIRRVLRKDGVVFLNLGDNYANPSQSGGGDPTIGVRNLGGTRQPKLGVPPGLKAKDLVGMPWRVALALQSDGWYLRSDIIWHKPAPMPESVKDRPTRSHEYIFLLTKSNRYFYDAEAVREGPSEGSLKRLNQSTFDSQTGGPKDYGHGINPNRSCRQTLENFAKNPGRNLRDVWILPTRPYLGAHYATFPVEIPEVCIRAGTSEKGCCAACGTPYRRILSKGLTDHSGETESDYEKGSNANRLAKLRQAAREQGDEYVNEKKTIGWEVGCECELLAEQAQFNINRAQVDNAGGVFIEKMPCTVLDPFNGHGTSGLVATRLGRNYIGIEINPEDCEATKRRIEDDAPLFNQVEIKK